MLGRAFEGLACAGGGGNTRLHGLLMRRFGAYALLAHVAMERGSRLRRPVGRFGLLLGLAQRRLSDAGGTP